VSADDLTDALNAVAAAGHRTTAPKTCPVNRLGIPAVTKADPVTFADTFAHDSQSPIATPVHLYTFAHQLSPIELVTRQGRQPADAPILE
jgi:hypothetical protein